MTCACITEIETKLEEHKLDLAIMYSRDRHTLEARPFTALLRKDNGRRESRRNKPNIFAATFCPFCGARYEAADAASHQEPDA